MIPDIDTLGAGGPAVRAVVNIGDAALYQGHCRDILRTLPDASVDSIVTDPPYELGFMGKTWDRTGVANDPATWREALRVLKPGGHLLAFGGTRTQHRMVCAIEDAGFEIRDQIGWAYGSGFPKSLDVSKAIDAAAGAEREAVGLKSVGNGNRKGEGFRHDGDSAGIPVTAPATAEAEQWDGWGTALKPAWEPICVARKPLAGTVAANVLQHGTGGLNIGACRIPVSEIDARDVGRQITRNVRDGDGWGMNTADAQDGVTVVRADGRWPANLIHDGSDEVLALFPQTESGIGAVKRASSADGHGNAGAAYGAESRADGTPMVCYGDAGSAARFFYCAKASAEDRNEGCERLPPAKQDPTRAPGAPGAPGGENPRNRGSQERTNFHPTVKPTDLMRYLCRLVTPPGGTVLDIFAGSGSTGKAAVLEGFKFIGIELSPEYLEIARARIDHARRMGHQPSLDLEAA